MNDTAIILSIAGGIIVILGFLGGVIGFLTKVSAEIAVHKQNLETACEDVEAAHEKIRRIDPIIGVHSTAIAVLNTDIGYIKQGIDDIKLAVRSARA